MSQKVFDDIVKLGLEYVSVRFAGDITGLVAYSVIYYFFVWLADKYNLEYKVGVALRR